jgi:hypothetical protein
MPEFLLLLSPARRARGGLTTLAESLGNIGCLPFGVANLFFVLTWREHNFNSLWIKTYRFRNVRFWEGFKEFKKVRSGQELFGCNSMAQQ